MAQVSRFFEGVTFSESDLAEPFGDMISDGVFGNRDNRLAVSAPGGMVVNVATGRAMIQGFWFKNDAVVGLAIGANGTGSNRIDRVVVRLDRAANTVTLAIRQGVAGAGVPAMSRAVGGAWELTLAQVTVVPGASNIVTGNLADVRDFINECGWAGESLFSQIFNPFFAYNGAGSTLQVGFNFGVVTIQPLAGGTLSLGNTSSAINAFKINYLQGANTFSEGLRFHNVALQACGYIWANTDASMSIAGNNGVTSININTAGQVRIGAATIGPAALFHIKQSGANPLDSLRIENPTTSVNSGAYHDSAGNFIIYSGTQTLVFGIAGTQINLSGSFVALNGQFVGSLLVGTSSTFTGGVTASAGITCGGNLLPSPTNTQLIGNAGNKWVGGVIGAAVIDNNGIFPPTPGGGQLGGGGNLWGSLYTSNGYKPGGGSWTDSSDDRLKDHTQFRPYDQGLDVVLKLKPVYYRYNGDYGLPTDRDFVGFRAQELQQIAPAMVGKHMLRRDPEDADSEDEMLSVDTSHMQFMHTLAIQELYAEIEALKQQLKERTN